MPIFGGSVGGSGHYALAVLTRRVLAVVPAPVALVTCLLPWANSGTTVRSAFTLGHALQNSGALSARWEQVGVDVGYDLPAIIGCCLAAAVLGHLRLSVLLGAFAGIVVFTGSIIAIIDFGASAGFGPWFGAFGSGAAIVVSVAAAFG